MCIRDRGRTVVAMTGMRKRIYVVCGSILLCMAVCLAAACTSSRDGTASGKGKMCIRDRITPMP